MPSGDSIQCICLFFCFAGTMLNASWRIYLMPRGDSSYFFLCLYEREKKLKFQKKK